MPSGLRVEIGRRKGAGTHPRRAKDSVPLCLRTSVVQIRNSSYFPISIWVITCFLLIKKSLYFFSLYPSTFFTIGLVERPVCRIYLGSGEDFITMEWSGYATSGQFRAGTEQMLAELTRHGLNKVLGDVRDMVLISADDQEWVHQQFLPRALQQGFRAIALVRPNHYFNKVAIESMAYKMNDESLNIRVFNSADEARNWLACLSV